MLATTMVMAMFVVLGPLSNISFANPGVWEGNNLIYENNTYTPAPLNVPRTVPNIDNPKAYSWVDEQSDPDRAYVIYFDADKPLSEQASATMIVYDFNGVRYTNPSDPTTVDIEQSDQAEEGDGTTVPGTTCNGDITHGLGWILCPVSNWLADTVDGLFEIIKSYLEVAPFRKSNDGIYELWNVVRAIANVAFVIAFLIIIYSQLTSIGISNYGIKTMLPRLIVAAILVNASFYVCALAVDLSNLIGININSIFVSIREQYVTGGDVALSSLNWSTVINWLLIGGAGAAAAIGFTVAAAGSFTSLFFIGLASLIGVAFSVLIAFIILAARQAIIVVLVLLSPLAFVALVLPTTKNLFDRWRTSFTTLLVFFPLFGVLFGGSQLAGAAILNSTVNDPEGAKLHIILMGLAVQTVPLVITPLIIRFSTGLLGQIANLSNNSARGLTDRAKNWSHANAEYHKQKALAGEKKFSSRRPFQGAARALHRRNLRKENELAGYKARADVLARGGDATRRQRQIRRRWEDSDRYKRQSEAELTGAQKQDEVKFKELQAGSYTYTSPEAIGAINTVTRGRYQRRLDQKHTEQSAQAVSVAEETALRLAVDGTRASMAERKEQKNYAARISDPSAKIQVGDKEVDIQHYAAGIMGKEGLNSVAAQVKKIVSEAEMKDAQNIQDTLSYELQTNPAALERAFLSATTMTERLAYANQMSKMGRPGFLALRKSIVEWEKTKPSKVDNDTLKELLGTNGAIMSGGKDLETWITNDGGKGREFATITNDIETWSNLSAKAFASMNQVSQEHALDLMKSRDSDLYNEYRRTLLEDPTALSSMKITVRRKHNLFLPGESITPVDDTGGTSTST